MAYPVQVADVIIYSINVGLRVPGMTQAVRPEVAGELSRQCSDNFRVWEYLRELDHASEALLIIARTEFRGQLSRQRSDNLSPYSARFLRRTLARIRRPISQQ